MEIFGYTGHFGMGSELFLVRFELSHRVFGDVEDNSVENCTELWGECMGNLTTIAEGDQAGSTAGPDGPPA